MPRRAAIPPLTVLGLLLAACGGGKDDSGQAGPGGGGGTAADDAIVIPVVAPYSGDLATYGESVKKGAQLKIHELNEAGGIDGKEVVIKLVDDVGQAKEAANVATRLKDDRSIVVVVGHLTSSASLAASPIYEEGGLPAISPASTNPDLCEGSLYYFRNIFSDSQQGAFLARYCDEVKGWGKIAVLFETNDYSAGLKDAFAAEAEGRGIEIVAEESYRKGTNDFKPQLAKIRQRGPQALFVPGYAPEGSLIITQARQAGLEVPIFGGDGLDDDEKIAGNEHAEGVFVSTPFLPALAGDRAAPFIAAYEEAYGAKPNFFAANTYDAVGLAAAAIAAAGSDRGKIRDHLAGIRSEEEAYVGAAGKTWFDEHGNCLKAIYIKVVREGGFAPAEEQLAVDSGE